MTALVLLLGFHPDMPSTMAQTHTVCNWELKPKVCCSPGSELALWKYDPWAVTAAAAAVAGIVVDVIAAAISGSLQCHSQKSALAQLAGRGSTSCAHVLTRSPANSEASL